MREASLERAFKRAVKRKGGDPRKLVTPGRKHAQDRLVLWPAKFCGQIPVAASVDFVELKKPGEKLRAGQQREFNRMRRNGFNVFAIDSHEEIAAYVKGR